MAYAVCGVWVGEEQSTLADDEWEWIPAELRCGRYDALEMARAERTSGR